jgi:hypothetical protein
MKKKKKEGKGRKKKRKKEKRNKEESRRVLKTTIIYTLVLRAICCLTRNKISAHVGKTACHTVCHQMKL